MVADQPQNLELYDALTFAPVPSVHVDCVGAEHADCSADGSSMIASCEFSHRLLTLDLRTRQVVVLLDLPGSSPLDVRLAPGGLTLYGGEKDPVATRRLPGGGSPDMGGVGADGSALRLAGRYETRMYEISISDGHLIAAVRIPHDPHGRCVWSQPGRYSLGHTGDIR